MPYHPIILFVKSFCINNLAHCGLDSLYLIGSRSTGKITPKSDYDFIAVMSDSCSVQLITSGAQWKVLYDRLNSQRMSQGFTGIDLFIKRKTSFLKDGAIKGSALNPAWNALNHGVKII